MEIMQNISAISRRVVEVGPPPSAPAPAETPYKRGPTLPFLKLRLLFGLSY
jgi:hypothetical protein